MMRPVAIATASLALALPSALPAQAGSGIAEAQRLGIVGERIDGYLGFVATPTPLVRKQVAGVNIKRRALYYDLAKRRGVTPQEVGITAACQLLARVPVGQYYLLVEGQWRRRQPGEGSPKPDYCG